MTGAGRLSSGFMSRRAHPPLAAAAALVAAVGLALAACGGQETVQKSIDATRVGEGAGFVPSTITVDKRNRVGMEVGNTTDRAHGFSIEGYGIQEVVEPGQTIEVDFVAGKAGTYRIYCHLHEAHQPATLVVQ